MCDITSHFCLAGVSLVYVWDDMHEFLPAYLEDTAKKDFKMEKKKSLQTGRDRKHVYVNGPLTGSHA